MTMSRKELSRISWLSKVKAKELSLRSAAEKMSISYRQAKRIWKRYDTGGEAGLIHGLRGKRSNRQSDDAHRERVLTLMREKYSDFGCTLASEYLLEEDKLSVPVETLRHWLQQTGEYQRRRKGRPHLSWRPRRERSGELVQMDGSPHAWFGDRGPKAVLMEMVDDATGRTLSRFYEEETTEAAMDLFHRYVKKYGLPQALYVDHDSIYETARKTSTEEALTGELALTQFGRAMKELGVHIILANSPQAKGRVERRHGVMQDRLIKVMRLKGINTIAEANRMLDDGFLTKENVRFVKKAKCPKDGHRRLPKGVNLHVVLSIQEERVVRNDWTVVWRNQWFQLEAVERKRHLVKKRVQVCRLLDGTIQWRYRDRELKWKELPGQPAKVRVVVEKRKHKARKWKPGADHPWRGRRAVL
jgi:transposase